MTTSLRAAPSEGSEGDGGAGPRSEGGGSGLAAARRLDLPVAVPGGVLRIVSWNCRSSLDPAKAARLGALGAVAAVVQECAPGAALPGYHQVAWNGPPGDRGTGVYVRVGIAAEPLPATERALLWGVPVRLPGLGLDVVGVWGFKRGWHAGPPGPVAREAIEDLAPVLERGRALVLGDFNDRPRFDAASSRSFRRTCGLLADRGCASLHHHATAEGYGEETARTFFRGGDAYLIDHAFASAAVIARLRAFSYGGRVDWCPPSDHVPMVVGVEAE